MVCGVFQQIKNIHHSSFLYENSDFPTFYPETFSSCVCHQGAYRFGSPVLDSQIWWKAFRGLITLTLTVLVVTIDALGHFETIITA